MKTFGACSMISWLFIFVFFGSASNVLSQDLFSEISQLKKDLSDLRNEVYDLRDLVYGFRKALLDSTHAPGHQKAEREQPKEEKAARQDDALDDQQLTKIICRAVGEFFSQAEAVLRASDSSTAQTGMRNALQKMNAALRDHAKTHRVSKILNIYEGVAWDTYQAVELRHSVAGNEDFIKALQAHKRKYMETCPRE